MSFRRSLFRIAAAVLVFAGCKAPNDVEPRLGPGPSADASIELARESAAPPVSRTADASVAEVTVSDASVADASDARSASEEKSDSDLEYAMAEAMAREGKRGCAGESHIIDRSGQVASCYPYRCRKGACLTRCKNTDDCVPSAKPGESLWKKGWPILCGGHVAPGPGETAACLPLRREDVHPTK